MAKDRYSVLRKLDSGGMAEVYLGEAESLQGFKKQVAIKRVLPQLAQNQKFIAMFLDEARIGLHLNHANVVQVFDIGVSKDTYFIVMEYVDGVNFKLILDVSQRRGQLLPVPQTVYILIEICKALSYAHELADEHGRLRGIVHRDVSPPNVLLSKRGEVKLVDFGLAKAVDQLETTDPGVIKGKFSYLSPEAVSQQEVDARADIFAAGILLWETLTNQRLFLGTNDFETIELVRRATVPSVIERNPHVPPALEQVVLRALARDRNHRFQSAREFGDALTEVLFSHAMKVSNFDIGALVTGMIHEEASPGEPSRIEKLIEEELLRFTTIDEDNNPVGSISPEIIDDNIGAQPLDFSSFEDPRTWAGEMLGEGGEPLGLNGDEPTIQQEPSEELKALMAEVGGILVDDGSAVIPGDLESQFEPDEESVNAQEPRKGSKVSVALKIILAILLIALLGVGATIALLLIQPP